MFSRRSFLGAAALPAAAPAQTRPEAKNPGSKSRFRARVHPLEGIARENLKITDIKATLMSYELPKDKQWVVGRAVTWKTDAVLVEIFTDKGIVGIGESSPYGGPPQLKKTIEEFIKPALTGKNPFDVEHLAVAGTGGARAWAGVDAALWDIIGKARSTPVYKLLSTGAGAAPPKPR
jgi:L-alanine-DL-glutamate epimerase-like enolase superfamily enzyme